MNISKSLVIYILSFIVIIFIIFKLVSKNETNIYDIEIINVKSDNIKLNNIIKDNYLLIDPMYLNESNEITLTIKNNSHKYDFYIDLECEDVESYNIYSNLNHFYIKSNSEINENIVIDVMSNNKTDFIKCYIKNNIM